MPLPEPDAAIRAPGPWTHRDVAANGARFHVVDIGTGPAVLLLHGFPTFWWTWRRQLAALADAGYRAIAMDLRGYGGSDHPPDGYDPRTLAADVAGVIRCLGETEAVIVGHGWGGLAAWSTAVLEPEVVRAIVPVSMPHPRQLRGRPGPRRTSARGDAVRDGLPVPFSPERSLTARDGAARAGPHRRVVARRRVARRRDGRQRTESAFLRWPTAHTAVEYHRWAVRSSIRPDGLHVHVADGGADPAQPCCRCRARSTRWSCPGRWTAARPTSARRTRASTSTSATSRTRRIRPPSPRRCIDWLAALDRP